MMKKTDASTAANWARIQLMTTVSGAVGPPVSDEQKTKALISSTTKHTLSVN